MTIRGRGLKEACRAIMKGFFFGIIRFHHYMHLSTRLRLHTSDKDQSRDPTQQHYNALYIGHKCRGCNAHTPLFPNQRFSQVHTHIA